MDVKLLKLFRTIVRAMKDFQNSEGFFKTKLISKESLISKVSNFEFSNDAERSFSDTELRIPKRLMLGKRAERYFSEWVKQSEEYDLIAENIQIIDQKQTLGEFDFIVRRKSDAQLIHVELVYKFYVFDTKPAGSEFVQWIGPNRKDRLDFKLNKLADHQFPLLFVKPAKEKLKSLKIDTANIQQQVLFLANLFVPIDHHVNVDEVNVDAIEGTWMSLSDWDERASDDDQFAIPAKTDWFSRELVDADWFSKEEMREKIRQSHEQQRSPLIYSKSTDGKQRRDFVVYW